MFEYEKKIFLMVVGVVQMALSRSRQYSYESWGVEAAYLRLPCGCGVGGLGLANGFLLEPPVRGVVGPSVVALEGVDGGDATVTLGVFLVEATETGVEATGDRKSVV